jgi:hypothetical protein
MIESEFLTDRDIGQLLSVSPNTIRVQRHYRRHNKDHFLRIDPVMIGSLPRYARDDVLGLIEELKGPKSN